MDYVRICIWTFRIKKMSILEFSHECINKHAWYSIPHVNQLTLPGRYPCNCMHKEAPCCGWSPSLGKPQHSDEFAPSGGLSILNSWMSMWPGCWVVPSTRLGTVVDRSSSWVGDIIGISALRMIWSLIF